MKKFLVSALATVVLVSFGSVFAQQTADHQLRVTIPDVLMIRILTDDGTSPFVAFDFLATQATFLAALDTGAMLPATDGNLTSVQVLAIGSSYTVDASASAFTLAGLARGDVLVQMQDGNDFRLDSGDDIATGGATGGWFDIGIATDSYFLFIDGDEAAGTDTITVTYSIFSN